MPSGLSLFFAMLPLLACLVQVSAAACEEYKGSFCQEITSQYPAGIYVGQVPQEALEDFLETSSLKNMTMLFIFYPQCRFDTLRRYCTQLFPPCDSTNTIPIPACRDVCETFAGSCSSFFPVFPELTPNCTSLPTTECFPAKAVPYAIPEENVCPEPMVPNPFPEVPNSNCPGGLCCFQCPNVDNFYPEGVYWQHQLAYNIIYAILGLGALFVFVSHLVIPSKRVMSQITIISIAASLFIGTIASWIVIIAGPTKSFCDSPVSPSNPGTDNGLCIAQATFKLFSSLATAYWLFCLSLNIHLIVFWKVTVNWWILIFYHLIGWVGPLVVVIVLDVRGMISYAAGSTCSVEPEKAVNAFVIPVAVAVFSSLLLNIITFGRVTYIAVMLRSKIQTVLALQFRPMIYSVMMAVSLAISWAFFTISRDRSNDLSWASSWYVCLGLGNGQDECSKIAKPHVLELYRYAIVAAFSFVTYLLTFIFFGLKRDVLSGWKEVFTSQPPSESPTTSNPGSDKTTIHMIKRDLSDSRLPSPAPEGTMEV